MEDVSEDVYVCGEEYCIPGGGWVKLLTGILL